jgi:phage FluMu protein Com
MKPVKCGKCQHILGRFEAEGDHSGVWMECPKCKEVIFISNQKLAFEEEDTVVAT